MTETPPSNHDPESPEVEPDLREELSELTAALLAHVEWLRESGADGLGVASEALRTARHELPEEAWTAADAPPATSARPRGPGRTSAEPTQRAHSAGGAPAHSESVPRLRRDEEPELSVARLASDAPAAGGGRGPTREGRARLAVLQNEVSSCTKCGLHAARTQTVFARGNGSARLCFIGEGPGADEDAQGEPFVGKAGQLLDKMIAAMGFSRDEVYVCNIVKCRPPENRKPDPDEMAACMPYLKEQIELVDPEVIVALGATAVQGLFGTTGGITKMRGRMRLYRGKIAVMPTFHPAYLLRNPAAKRDVWSDLQAVLRQMGRPIPKK